MWRVALDLIYPRHCLACGIWLGYAREGYVCADCEAKVKRIGAERCGKCGMPAGPYTKPQNECAHCRGAELRFRRATAPCRYEGVMRELVHAFKYRKAAFLARSFADLMISDLAAGGTANRVTLVAPVPLHWRKRASRGYNQAELLAEKVAAHYELPLASRCLVRVRDTPTQTALSRAERQDNLRGAFAAQESQRVKGQTVLLCDDVMTTGATASECARVLLAAGAKAVYVSVAAR